MEVSDVFSKVRDPTSWLVFAIAFMAALYLLRTRRTNLPPGPRPLPLIGNFPLLAKLSGKYFFAKLLNLREQYGDVVRLQLGPRQNVVVLFGQKAIREAVVYKNDDFRFRPVTLFPLNYIFKNRGVIFGNGDMHTALRKFTVVSLRDFGVGKISLETKIQEEASLLCDDLQKFGGKPTVLADLNIMNQSSANVIAGIVYGSRFERNDPELLELVQDISTFFKVFSFGLIEVYLPILRFLPSSKLRLVFKAFKRVEKFAKAQIAEHRTTFDPNNIRDFVDYYLQSETTTDKFVSEDNLFRVIVELFVAGTETTASALNWSVFFLCQHPDIQDRCRQEIYQVVGTGRFISIGDKAQFPFLRATMNEVLRMGTIAPLAAPRTVMADVELGGYTIPKHSVVLCHLNSALLDPAEWNNPEEFRPERFLDKDGEFQQSADAFMPFGSGGRMCLGRHLVKMEFLIFLGTLLQRFDFRFPDGSTPPPTERVQTGVTSGPPRFPVCAVPL